VSSAMSSEQNHSGLLPKDREGMSASAFSTPGMCTGVSGHALWRLRRRATARTSLVATRDFREANLSTQLTVGKLSLMKAMCLCAIFWAIPSRHSHSKSMPAISRYDTLSDPLGFWNDARVSVTLHGHCSRNTGGGMPDNSPNTTRGHGLRRRRC
jgi:hypothetical protein